MDFDELIYGDNLLSELISYHPEIKDGLIKYLYDVGTSGKTYVLSGIIVCFNCVFLYLLIILSK